MAEREANDRLRAEEPAAFEAKMREQLPTSKCCLCGEPIKGLRPQRSTPCATRAWRATRATRATRAERVQRVIMVPQRIRKWPP
jgi:hypothetical protein